MDLTQNWVGRLDRSFQTIFRSLLTRLITNAPEITDHSDQNPLIILMKAFSGVGEVIHLYIDSWSKEAFLGTARRYKSVVKLVKLIDYQIKAKIYATVNEQFTIVDANTGLPVVLTTDLIIPAGTIVTSVSSAISFKLINSLRIPAGQTSAFGSMAQYNSVSNELLGNTDGTPNQQVFISDRYVHGTMKLTIGLNTYNEYSSFALMGPEDKGFIIQIDEDQNASIILGDGENGIIPPSGQTIYADYLETEGASGNLPPNTITQIGGTLTLPDNIRLTAYNPDYSSGGANFETMEYIRKRAPRSLRSMDRAVTYQDYVDVAMQPPSIGAAEVSYCCGKYVNVYVVPISRGVATPALLQQVQDYMDCRKMITTKVKVLPAGITRVWIQANIIGAIGYTQDQIKKDVLAALDTNYGQDASKINQRVSITDYIATVEGVRSVDSFQVQKIKIEPYVRPLATTANPIAIQFLSLPVGTTQYKYTLIYRSATNRFEFYKQGVFVQSLSVNDVYADAVLSFKITPGIYANNDSWEFTSYPSYPEIFPNTIIEINDFSEPIIDVSPFVDDNTPRTIFGSMSFQTQSSTSSCLPPCN